MFHESWLKVVIAVAGSTSYLGFVCRSICKMGDASDFKLVRKYKDMQLVGSVIATPGLSVEKQFDAHNADDALYHDALLPWTLTAEARRATLVRHTKDARGPQGTIACLPRLSEPAVARLHGCFEGHKATLFCATTKLCESSTGPFQLC